MAALLIILAVVLLVAVAVTAAPAMQRMGKAVEEEQRASMPGGMDMDLDREFERPRDEGDLL